MENIKNVILNEYLHELNNKLDNLNSIHEELINLISNTLLIDDNIVDKDILDNIKSDNLEIQNEINLMITNFY